MKQIKTIIFLFFLILLSTSVLGSYPYVGGENNEFLADIGLFTYSFVDYTPHTTAVTSLIPPMYDDLDGDGENEVILMDLESGKIRLYHFDVNNGWTNFASTGMGGKENISNVEIFDYDGDGYKEVIWAVDAGSNLYINKFEWNGTNFRSINPINSVIGSVKGYEIIVGCREIDKCFVAYTSPESYVIGSTRIYGHSFNSSSTLGAQTLLSHKNNDGLHCFPRIKTVEYFDYDNDGNMEYVFSYGIRASVNPVYTLVSLEIGDDMSLTKDKEVNITGWDTTASGNCNTSNLGASFTSPSISNYDSSETGYEIAMGYMKDNDEFKLRLYNRGFSEIDTYPTLFDADGIIVSNIIETKAFDDTSFGEDFCVLGYHAGNNEYDLLCASEETGNTIKSEEYFWSNQDSWAVSQNYMEQKIMIHSGNQWQSVTDDLYEVYTTHGIFMLDPQWLGVGNDLVRLWDHEYENGILMAWDVEQTGLGDIIYMTDQAMIYIDDEFTNSYGYINDDNCLTNINPSPNAVWKINTTVSVQIRVSDIDGDNVCARAYLYYDDINEQYGNESCGSSGSLHTFQFKANKTGNNYIVRLEGNDIINNESTQTNVMEFWFSVADEGIEYSDGIIFCPLGAPPPGSNAPAENLTEGVELEADTNHSFHQAITQTNDILGIGGTSIWLLLMAGIGIAMFIGVRGQNFDFKIMAGIVGIIELFMLILGVKLGYISGGILWTIIIISLVIIGATISRRFIATGG